MAPDTLKEVLLPSTPESAARARAEVRDWLGAEHRAYEPVRLAVSELVTNGVRHARHGVSAGTSEAEPLVLRLSSCGDQVRVEVTDRGLAAVNPQLKVDPVSLLAEGGRGLAIIDMLSEGRWGFHANPDGPGRTVWCEIPAAPPSYEERLTESFTPASFPEPFIDGPFAAIPPLE
ncbi:ATP-binding protein [Sphaerisporangium fuscum]|uniref:ATP-binding protein n=1 Tax=Sphaerisporangium fuscum TaxID=2835868 RepID=UPI001BDD340B|nr:ATP-binding protein [Sphaerisporangium fuscum]